MSEIDVDEDGAIFGAKDRTTFSELSSRFKPSSAAAAGSGDSLLFSASARSICSEMSMRSRCSSDVVARSFLSDASCWPQCKPQHSHMIAPKYAHLFRQSLRTVINPCNKPAFLRLLHPSNTCPPQVLDELRQGDPSRRIHMQVLLVLNEFLIYVVGFDSVCAKPPRQQLDEVVLELLREIGDMPTSILSHSKHLT